MADTGRTMSTGNLAAASLGHRSLRHFGIRRQPQHDSLAVARFIRGPQRCKVRRRPEADRCRSPENSANWTCSPKQRQSCPSRWRCTFCADPLAGWQCFAVGRSPQEIVRREIGCDQRGGCGVGPSCFLVDSPSPSQEPTFPIYESQRLDDAGVHVFAFGEIQYRTASIFDDQPMA